MRELMRHLRVLTMNQSGIATMNIEDRRKTEKPLDMANGFL